MELLILKSPYGLGRTKDKHNGVSINLACWVESGQIYARATVFLQFLTDKSEVKVSDFKARRYLIS
jgi:hypothetical protein